MSYDLDDHISAALTRAAEAAQLAAPSRADVAALAGRRKRRRRVRAGVLTAALATLAVACAVALVDQPPGRTVAGHEVPTTAPTADFVDKRPIVESLPLRGNGIGPFDFGAPRDQVVAAVTAELGAPSHSGPEPGASGCPAFDESVDWPGLELTFGGPRPDALVLTQWATDDMGGPAKRLRMAGGPAVGDLLSAWQAAYGSRYEASPGSAQGSGEFFVVHLPGGDVTASALEGRPPRVSSLVSGTACADRPPERPRAGTQGVGAGSDGTRNFHGT